MHLHESAKRILNEEASKRNTEILREAFQYDDVVLKKPAHA